MKILIATGIYPPSIGGPATYSKLLFDELPKRGHHVNVFSFDSVRHLPKVVRHLSYFYEIFQRAKNADVVYAQDPVSVGLPALCAARLKGKKFVLKIVGDYAWEQGSQRRGITEGLDTFSARKSGYPMLVTLLKCVQSFVAGHSDKIIVPSNYLKKVVTNWGVNPSKITVVYNAFEADISAVEPREGIREALGIQGTIITSVGRLVPWKGFKCLVDVVGRLKDEVGDIKLLIIGDGPDMPVLQKYVVQRNLGDTVLLTGKLPQTELFRYIKASDVFVLNTQYEGFSHQLLEVMALGTPVVTTRVGGNPELVNDGENGHLVEYNNADQLKTAILTFLKVEGEASRLVKKAHESLKKFNKEEMLERIEAELGGVSKK